MFQESHNQLTQIESFTEGETCSYAWDEDAEIQYVLKEEDEQELHVKKREDLLHRMMHGRLLNKQMRRSRHIPEIFYAPAIFVGW